MKKAARYPSVKGFTLIELFVSIAILGILIAISTPYLFGFREKEMLGAERDRIVSRLKIAQQKAISARKGYDYGLRFDQANASYEHVFVNLLADSPTYQTEGASITLPDKMQIEAISSSSVVFRRLSGQPDSPFEITLGYKRSRCKVQVSSVGVITGTLPERR